MSTVNVVGGRAEKYHTSNKELFATISFDSPWAIASKAFEEYQSLYILPVNMSYNPMFFIRVIGFTDFKNGT